jgi:hypothetical protein
MYQTSFGISTFTAINRTTKMPYGEPIKILAGMSGSADREMINLTGGSNPNVWDSESGSIASEIEITVKEFASWLYTLAGYTVSNATGAAVTYGAATNQSGSSVVSATTGITGVSARITAATDDTGAKEGLYVLKATAATTLTLYQITDVSDVSFTTETTGLYGDSIYTGKVASYSVTTGAAVDMTAIGVKFTGGSGTIGFTIGDTAMFEIKQTNSGYQTLIYGESPEPVEFGAYIISQKKSAGGYTRLELPRVKLASVPSTMTEKAWAEAALKGTILYDSTAGYSHYISNFIR